jgi:opacity protein-like surface antigen
MKPFAVVVLVLVHGLCFSQAKENDGPFQVLLKGTLTTGTLVFPYPESADAIKRSESIDIGNSLGYGVEVRYFIPGSNVGVGLGIEHERATTATSFPISRGRSIPAIDGYSATPIELSGFFIIPFSGPVFSVHMGGGVGVYMGKRIFSIAGVEAASTDNGNDFGIHVLAGFEFQLGEFIAVGGEMKFRDLHFTTSNAFPVSQIRWGNEVVSVSTAPFPSRISTDGVVFQLELTYTP